MANLLAQHTLAELIDIVEADLSDSGNTRITAAEVQAAIRNAIYDINRVLPDQKIYELTLDFTVTNESVTITALGVWYSLANSPVEYGTEVVKNSALTVTYTRDTDYLMDYSNGKIQGISGGGITAGDIVKVSYEKSKLAINLSSLTDLIRVAIVEYPIGNVPQAFADFSIWGDFLYVRARAEKTGQEKMGDTNHIVIYYEAEHNIAIV